MVRFSENMKNWLVAGTVSLGLHVLVVVAVIFSLTGSLPGRSVRMPADPLAGDIKPDYTRVAVGARFAENDPKLDLRAGGPPAGTEMTAYRFARGGKDASISMDASIAPTPLPAFVGLGADDGRSLARKTPIPRLLPPDFSDATIPSKPEKSMWQTVSDTDADYLSGDIFQNVEPATYDRDVLLQAEAIFRAQVRDDILDGWLDMPFSDFIIPAEYFHLSRALLAKGLQPDFTLQDAFMRYRKRLARIGAQLAATIDGHSLVMILQRYAENKYYPGNGSGMLLDSLYHNLNDCEGGTKEILAYLDDLYPGMTIGSNRGLLKTNTGVLIGHMQAYIGPGPATENIIANDKGVVIETTRIGPDSVQAYRLGELHPLEDFVLRYYPDLGEGTPLSDRVRMQRRSSPTAGRDIVGSSNHPLKMGYGAPGALLSEKLYDLAGIRTHRIDNGFEKSTLAGCDPEIDPTRVTRANLFSNFVAIDKKLRRSLIRHYLADLQYWDNQLMPQWKEPDFIATYKDFTATLMAADGPSAGYLQVDAENAVPIESVWRHRSFIKALQADARPVKDPYLGTGEKICSAPAWLDEKVLSFLFHVPRKPGLFLLEAPGRDFSWERFLDAVVHDCLAIPANSGIQRQIEHLEAQALDRHSSFRMQLYQRGRLLGLSPNRGHQPLLKASAALTAVFSGAVSNDAEIAVLKNRVSTASSPMQTSVHETVTEQGRTGIADGLLWDGFDFLGTEKMKALLLRYARRADLRLTVHRANGLVGALVQNMKNRGIAPELVWAFMQQFSDASRDENLRFSAFLARARLDGQTEAGISRLIADFLSARARFRLDAVTAWRSHGLSAEDALEILDRRIQRTLAALPRPGSPEMDAAASDRLFLELVELTRGVAAFEHRPGQVKLRSGMARSVMADGAFKDPLRSDRQPSFDPGLMFNKMYILANLQAAVAKPLPWGQEGALFFDRTIRFGAFEPVGKILATLLPAVFSKAEFEKNLLRVVARQFDALARLDVRGASRAHAVDQVKNILGDGNLIFCLLTQAQDDLIEQVVALAPVTSLNDRVVKAGRYLEKLHALIAKWGVTHGAGSIIPESSAEKSFFPADFYLDDRVRTSFALLAHVKRAKKDHRPLKFVKIKDLRSIKDPSKIKVIAADRKITRQDMSLLTLALNPTNAPDAIRQAWHDTLDVAGKHLALNPTERNFRQYLFEPHHPYLTVNDRGFFYSPEMVADIHNADQWGGRNDILLSSYLHFRNLPEHLPEWLLRTAMARSGFERQLIQKFEAQSFLPMILECTQDHKQLPAPLVKAKWAVRKPYGEDIFPATLLLLRMGYMDITTDGELVLTSKYAPPQRG